MIEIDFTVKVVYRAPRRLHYLSSLKRPMSQVERHNRKSAAELRRFADLMDRSGGWVRDGVLCSWVGWTIRMNEIVPARVAGRCSPHRERECV